MKELITAVNSVMETVENIDKGLTVGKGNHSYKGVSDKDVKLAFNKAMRDNGLAMFPTKVEPTTRIERWTEDSQYGPKQKQSVFTEVITSYTLYHESGQSIELQGYGHGTDPQDKAAGKATTYAMKYTLLYTFVTATGHIDDADKTHSNDVETPKVKAKQVLTANHPKYNECIEWLKGAGSMTKLKEGYEISKDVEEKLMAIVLA